MRIPVVDLFAGPGGLGEGFAAFRRPSGYQPFSVRLSIEKDVFAYRTLLLRSFLRNFPYKQVPEEYYAYCRGELTRDELFRIFPEAAMQAHHEAWHAELGKVSPHEVDERVARAIDGRKLWVLIGGPPCQAYSTVGRSRMRSADPEAFEADDRHFLYQEYLRILRKFSPPVFVMENVKGLLSSKIGDKGMFQRILRDLKRKTPKTKGYRIYSLVAPMHDGHLEPEDYLIRFEDYGIPQTRHRVILLGVRRDLPGPRSVLTPSTYRSTVSDAIKDLPPIRSKLSREPDTYENWLAAVRAIRDFDFGEYNADPEFLRNLWAAIDSASHRDPGHDRYLFTDSATRPPYSQWLQDHRHWFLDPSLNGDVFNHGARAHIREDLVRYLFLSVLGRMWEVSPKLRDFPVTLLPNHKNVLRALRSDNFADRFRVQVDSQPATTVVSHIAKDGHYYVHPDPTQCRSLTVREAARLQTFPDNYFFEGARTEQYRQVGNAVPPLFALRIAGAVQEILQDSRTERLRSTASATPGTTAPS